MITSNLVNPLDKLKSLIITLPLLCKIKINLADIKQYSIMKSIHVVLIDKTPNIQYTFKTDDKNRR